MRTRMSYDDVAWAKSDDIFNDWNKGLYTEQSFKAIGELIAHHRGGIPTELCAPIRVSFNVCLRMKFEDSGSAIIRFPCPGIVMFPEEKIRNEVAVIRFIEQNTSIPVPHVIYYGMTDESPCGLGSFIIMDYIEHTHDLVDALNTPGLTLNDRPVLDPQIFTERLEFVYSQMSDVLLEFHKHSFPRIGSLTRTDDDSWAVTSRPLTLNMNELVQLGNFPRSQLPSTFFDTSSLKNAKKGPFQASSTPWEYHQGRGEQPSDDCHRQRASCGVGSAPLVLQQWRAHFRDRGWCTSILRVSS